MILLLDTSTPLCKITLIDGDWRQAREWDAGRTLAKGLLGFLEQELATVGKTWQDLTGLGVFQGPGSFTGLRIGMTVLNTMADALSIPIVTTTGENWRETAESRLLAGENDQLALPFYGSEANITKPRK
ncbi:MAG: HAD-superfamily hydrolase, subfamily variant 3 [Candidatus Saccharibacteria bacterium]|nr:HAD-superfamily hydrolase, subfamily variant 3 [Candidatus Saccharibacteria bacterium]